MAAAACSMSGLPSGGGWRCAPAERSARFPVRVWFFRRRRATSGWPRRRPTWSWPKPTIAPPKVIGLEIVREPVKAPQVALNVYFPDRR